MKRTIGRYTRPAQTTTAPEPYRWSRFDTWSTALIGTFALITRFISLGSTTSNGTPIFDEKHYVPQAWDMVRSTFNPLLGGIESNPGFGLVVHPPLAKQLIAYGEYIFGYSPWGWRLITAAFGVATVLMIMALARRLSRNGVVAAMAGFIAVADGVLLVSSRFGMLDIFLVFFVTGAAWALAADFQRQARHFAAHGGSARSGVRWWRFTAGVFLGLALSVKWSGLYYMAFFGIYLVLADAYARYRYGGAARPLTTAIMKDSLASFWALVLVPVALYAWSWRAWFASETAVFRHAATDGTLDADSPLHLLPDTIASWFYYHASVLEFHGSLTSSGGHSHPWDSKPWSWLAATRPILYSAEGPFDCIFGQCRQDIYLFGTPAIWWVIVPALLWAGWATIVRRELNYVLPLVTFSAGFWPWVASYDRQMYFFYAAPLIPFVIVILALMCGRLIGTGTPVTVPKLHLTSMPVGTIAVAGYLGLVAAMFIGFSPMLFGYPTPDFLLQDLAWLRSWR